MCGITIPLHNFALKMQGGAYARGGAYLPGHYGNHENHATFKVVQFTSQTTSTSNKVADGGATDVRLLNA